MLIDYRLPRFALIRGKLSSVVAPFYYVVDWPVKRIEQLTISLKNQQDLLEANAALRAKELMLNAKLQTLRAKEKEHQRVDRLMNDQLIKHGFSNTFLPAHLLAVDLNNAIQQILIDKGRYNGVYVGQPVIDGYGVVGQVIGVSESTSRILLLTDVHSAVPVQVERTGFRAIAVGQGNSDTLTLINIPDTVDLKTGDRLITSGLGLRYPAGYPVGQITSVTAVNDHQFAQIVLTPSAHLHQGHQVLLVWQKKDHKKLVKAIRQQRYAPLPGHKNNRTTNNELTYKHTIRY